VMTYSDSHAPHFILPCRNCEHYARLRWNWTGFLVWQPRGRP